MANMPFKPNHQRTYRHSVPHTHMYPTVTSLAWRDSGGGYAHHHLHQNDVTTTSSSQSQSKKQHGLSSCEHSSHFQGECLWTYLFYLKCDHPKGTNLVWTSRAPLRYCIQSSCPRRCELSSSEPPRAGHLSLVFTCLLYFCLFLLWALLLCELGGNSFTKYRI